jgi:hypothetical protein
MPCRDYYTEQEDLERVTNRENAIKIRLDNITQKLCYMCGQAKELEVFNALVKDNPSLVTWWKLHCDSDEARVYVQMKESKSMNPEYLARYFIKKAEKVHAVSDWHKRWFLEIAKKVIKEKKKLIQENEEALRMRKEALNKLTDDDKRILGIERWEMSNEVRRDESEDRDETSLCGKD